MRGLVVKKKTAPRVCLVLFSASLVAMAGVILSIAFRRGILSEGVVQEIMSG